MMCTGFVRAFPSRNPERQELYNMMLDYSRHSFNEFTSGSNTRYGQASAFVRADPRNMSKTNPLPPKGKAVDLVSHQMISQQQSPQKVQSFQGANPSSTAQRSSIKQQQAYA